MEEWRELALTVPGMLMIVGTSGEALACLDVAVTKLAVRVEVARRFSMRAMFGDDEIFLADPAPEGVVPAMLLEDARRETACLSATHAAAGRVIALCRAHLGLGDGALWQRWELHRADTVRRTHEALGKLRSAASYAEAATDAFAVAQGVPYEAPLWDAWASAAEHLARRAHDETATARAAVCSMGRDVLLEFFDVWMLVKAVGKEEWKTLARTVPRSVMLVANYIPSEPSDSTTRKMLGATHGELSRLLALHAEAGHILTLSAQHLGVHGDGLWQRWHGHHHDVVRAGIDALRSMCSASSISEAMEVLCDGKPTDPTQLMCRARDEMRGLQEAMRRMRNAAVLEFFDATWMVLKRG